MFVSDLLKGQVILVTGGGSGLGLELARKFATLGAEVHICGRRQVVLDDALVQLRAIAGARVAGHIVDIRNPDAVQGLVDKLWIESPLTALVNNAAANFISPTERISARGFDAIANTVFHGTFYVTNAVGQKWIATGRPGSILSIVSTGVVNGGPFAVPSTMAKTAICAMTRALAIEWGSKGIRLNAIGPGLIPTPGAVARLFPGSSADDLARANPMGRLGRIDELQNLAAFLLSDQCAWLTGQIVMLDGAHHLAHGSVYSPLLKLTGEEWLTITSDIRAHDKADKQLRTATVQAATP